MDPLWEAIGDYASYIHEFIEDMEKVFPTLGKDGYLYAWSKIFITRTIS